MKFLTKETLAKLVAIDNKNKSSIAAQKKNLDATIVALSQTIEDLYATIRNNFPTLPMNYPGLLPVATTNKDLESENFINGNSSLANSVRMHIELNKPLLTYSEYQTYIREFNTLFIFSGNTFDTEITLEEFQNIIKAYLNAKLYHETNNSVNILEGFIKQQANNDRYDRNIKYCIDLNSKLICILSPVDNKMYNVNFDQLSTIPGAVASIKNRLIKEIKKYGIGSCNKVKHKQVAENFIKYILANYDNIKRYFDFTGNSLGFRITGVKYPNSVYYRHYNKLHTYLNKTLEISALTLNDSIQIALLSNVKFEIWSTMEQAHISNLAERLTRSVDINIRVATEMAMKLTMASIDEFILANMGPANNASKSDL